MKKMKNIKVVIGANYGDEGKGLMTDYFCSLMENPIVVCVNGGSQRGHTVDTPDGKHHIFHHFGSGSYLRASTYLASEYILNPMIFIEEKDTLAKQGLSFPIYLNENCRISTPFDMILNQVIESSRGDNRHGSCGFGIWETILRYRNTNAKTLKELMYLSKNNFKEYLIDIKNNYFYKRLQDENIISLDKEWEDIINNDNLIENYILDFNRMVKESKIVTDSILDEYDNIVFENGQGLRLDQGNKDYLINTTPSFTGLTSVKKIIDNIIDKKVEVCYVTRTYITKHGAGTFDEECEKEKINKNMVDLTNHPNDFQGSLRYGILDEEKMMEFINKDFGDNNYIKSLAITHINEYPFQKNTSWLLDNFINIYYSKTKDRNGIKYFKTFNKIKK